MSLTYEETGRRSSDGSIVQSAALQIPHPSQLPQGPKGQGSGKLGRLG